MQPLSVGDPYEDGPTRNRRLKKAAEAKYRASVVQRRAEKLKKQGKEVTEADTEAPELPPFKASGPTHRDSGIIFLSNIDKDTGDDEILRLAKVRQNEQAGRNLEHNGTKPDCRVRERDKGRRAVTQDSPNATGPTGDEGKGKAHKEDGRGGKRK